MYNNEPRETTMLAPLNQRWVVVPTLDSPALMGLGSTY